MKKLLSLVFITALSVMLFSGCTTDTAETYEPDGTVTGTVSVVKPDARLVFENEDVYLVAFTDPQGEYSADLKKGEYEVMADAEGCDLFQTSFAFEGGEHEVDLNLSCL